MGRVLRSPVKAACEAALLLSAVSVCGCASRLSYKDMWVHPEPLYLQERPYTRLYVEIDRMEDVDFPEYLVEELKAFLGQYCRKPDGIDVVLDPPIRLSEFRGVPFGAASILSTDGPAVTAGPQPAYLHLFVYDCRTMFKRAKRNPHTVFSGGPPCVCLNVDYVRHWPDAVHEHMLTHELGHALGLCHNTGHGDGTHCRKDVCLMHATPDWLSQLGGLTRLYYPEHRLCEDCKRDLALAQQAPRDDGVSFTGPFLVRRADGYCVASLPFYDTIILASAPSEFEWKKALQRARESIRQSTRPAADKGRAQAPADGTCWVSLYDRLKEDACAERLKQDITILNRVLNDPSPNVRRMAPGLLKMREDALHALDFDGNPDSTEPSS